MKTSARAAHIGHDCFVLSTCARQPSQTLCPHGEHSRVAGLPKHTRQSAPCVASLPIEGNGCSKTGLGIDVLGVSDMSTVESPSSPRQAAGVTAGARCWSEGRSKRLRCLLSPLHVSRTHIGVQIAPSCFVPRLPSQQSIAAQKHREKMTPKAMPTALGSPLGGCSCFGGCFDGACEGEGVDEGAVEVSGSGSGSWPVESERQAVET